ncbi:MAG TPA: O-antigen ligase family protein [Terriglobia bacterium]|nr:O-antigen ligase family protein [Terriglobia bacterium]
MDRILEAVLGLTIIGEVLAFGGVQPLAYSILEIVLFACLFALLARQTLEGRFQLKWPLWTLLFCLLVFIQTVPLPAAFVKHISPERVLPASVLEVIHESSSRLTLSIYPHATLLMLMKVLAYVCAFILAVYLFDSRKRKSTLVRILIYLGLFETAYGAIQYLTGWQKIFTFSKEYYTDSGTGTFINHNHFAGFLELTFPFVFGLIFYMFQTWQEERRRRRGTRQAGTQTSAGIATLFYSFLLVFMAMGFIFARSRSGVLVFISTLVFLGLLAQLKARKKAWMAGLVIFLSLVFAYALWIGLNPILARFEVFRGGEQYFQVEGRLIFWQDTLRLIHDYPWVGTGLGTFQYSFRHYQTGWLTFLVDHTHNDYMEVASETGLLGAALLFLPMIVLLIRMVVSFLTDTRRYRPSILLGCIGGTLAILLHSFTDFNLQIPANALTLAVVLGIGYKAACVERRAERQSRNGPGLP